MWEKLFELGFGFFVQIVKGGLTIWVPVVIAAVGLLAAAVEVWGKRRHEAWKQMDGAIVRAEASASFGAEAVPAIIGSFIVAGGVYGLLQLARRTFPSWGWPNQPDLNVHLAWLSVFVVCSVVIGIGWLDLAAISRKVRLDAFWVCFAAGWTVAAACAAQWLYPIAGLHAGVYAAVGVMSAALCMLLRGWRDDDAPAEAESVHGDTIVNN